MKTIEISQLETVQGGANDRAKLLRNRLEGNVHSRGGSASVDVDAGSFSGSSGSAKVTAFPAWGGSISGTCTGKVNLGDESVGSIHCSSPALTRLMR